MRFKRNIIMTMTHTPIQFMALQSDESNMDAAQQIFFNGDVLITSWHLMSDVFDFLNGYTYTYTHTKSHTY